MKVLGRRTRARAALVAAALGIVVGATQTGAQAVNADAQAIRQGIATFTQATRALAGHGLLADAVALTGVDPSGPQGLDLDRLLPQALALPSSFESLDPMNAPDAVRAAVEELDATPISVGGIAVRIGCAGTSTSCSTPVTAAVTSGRLRLSIPVHAERTTSTPVALPTNLASLEGGSLDVKLEADTTLPFVYDPALRTTTPGAPQVALALEAPTGSLPRLTLRATLLSTTTSLSTTLGFTDVAVGLDGLASSLELGIALRDPDVDGRLTADEWSSTAVGDLATLTRAGTTSGSLTLDSSLVPGTPDVTVPFDGTASTATPFAFPAIPAGALAPFRTVSPESVISAFGQAAAGLAGAHSAVDVPLPFLDGGLTKAFAVAQPLLDFVSAQGISCSTLPEPGGDLSRLQAGDQVGCSAFVIHRDSQQVEDVTWHVPTGAPVAAVTNTTPPASAGTLGMQPSRQATFRMTDDGAFAVTASYRLTPKPGVPNAPPAVTLTTERPAGSAQQLFRKLRDLGGFDELTQAQALTYDAATKALRFRLKKTFDPAASRLGYDVGDQLEKGSGLVGLRASGSPTMSVDVSGVAIDVTVGVLLVDEAAVPTIGQGQPCPQPSTSSSECPNTALDRFFVEVDPATGKPELQVGDASFAATLPQLSGRLGFLQVTTDSDATGAALAVSKRVGTAPVMTADIRPPTFSGGSGMNVGSTNFPHAIRLRELLFRLPELVSATPLNLALTGSLAFEATTTGGTRLGGGAVSIAWPDVSSGLPAITADTDFSEQLRRFDLDPNLFGTAGSTSSETSGVDTLVPASGGFPSGGSELVGKRLENLTDGSFCEVTAATGTSATCALAGGSDNRWQEGDEYRARTGDPLAMLYLLLDNLDDVVSGLDALTGGSAGQVYETDLPLVGVSPKDLVSQLQAIRRASTELRGAPTGAVVCGTERARDDAGTEIAPPRLTGDVSALGTAPRAIQCAVTHAKPAQSVRWEALSGATIGAGGTDVATVGQPATATVGITVTEPLGRIASPEHREGYRLKVTFTDVDGEHVRHFPEIAVPPTLQDFEAALEDKLGIGDVLDLGVLPAAGSAPRKITIGLGYGVCTRADLCPDGTADPSRRFSTPLNVDLGSRDLVGVGASADVAVDYSALAQLDLAVALSSSPAVEVLPTTQLGVKGRFVTDQVALTANFGPFGVLAGKPAKPDGTGVGQLKLGADFTLRGPATASSPSAFLGGLQASFANPAGPPVDCGGIDHDGSATSPDEPLAGIACARLSLGLQGDSDPYLGDVGFAVGGISSTGALTGVSGPYVPSSITTRLSSKLISWSSLLRAMPYLLERLEDGLSAGGSRAAEDAGSTKIPLVGDALDAGAGVVNTFRTRVVEPTLEPIGTAVTAVETTTVGMVKDQVRSFLHGALGPPGANLLQKRTGAPTGEALGPQDVVVLTECGGACTDSTSKAIDLTDVRIVMNLGQSVTGSLPFDVGLDGLPLNVAAAVKAQAGWTVRVDVGVNKETGPYLGVGSAGSPQEVRVAATVLLDEEPASTGGAGPVCERAVSDPYAGGTSPATGTFVAAEHRCLTGQLGFLGVNVRDHAGGDTITPANRRSRVQLVTSIDLVRQGSGGEKVLLTELLSGKLAAHVGLDVDALLNLRVRTGVAQSQVAGFPSLLGTFLLEWRFTSSTDPAVPAVVATPLKVEFNDLHLDAGAFVQKYLRPTLDEVRKVTSPFAPVVETLNAPLPVVSDLAALIGQPPLTLLGLMEQVSSNNLTVVKSLASFIAFANSDVAASGLIPLGDGSNGGRFGVDAAKADEPASPTTAGALVQPRPGGKGGDLLKKAPVPGTGTNEMASRVDAAKPTTKDSLPGTFGVPGLTFPFMADAGQIFGLMMGQDATLVRYDVGRLQATAGFSYDFGPFFIGPVPVTAGIGGSATLSGRFALGYDTSGIRKVLSGGTGVHLFDGIFLDDLDAEGLDVPEVSLVGEVYARAGVTVFVATAGIEGGIRMTVDLNLNDAPEPDGKLRIEEVFNKLSNPICLFDVSGKLEAFLRAFLEIDYFIDSERWDWEILRVTLLEFAGECAPPTPVLAEKVGGTLHLNMGPRAALRKINVGEPNEKMVVRPVDGSGRYSVSAFGVYQVFGPGITHVVAHGGAGNDVVLLEPGTTENAGGGAPLPFTATSALYGDGDDDTLSGGSRVDTIEGGSGNDKVDGGLGNDVLRGQGGNDTVHGGQGDDTVEGGSETDRLSGGPGTDAVDGGAGDDFVNGGPGTDPTDPTTAAASRDGGDTLAGGPGRDIIEGGWGADTAYGDAVLVGDFAARCAVDGGAADADRDSVDGGADGDTLFGGGGPDTVVGGDGADRVCGGGGNDTLDGDAEQLEPPLAPGNDVVDGGPGDDVLHGRAGSDVLRGRAGDDHVVGGDGDDDLVGGPGRDVLDGGGAVDVVVGDAGTISGSTDTGTATRPSGGSTALRALVTVVSTGTDATPAACTYTRHAVDASPAGSSDCLVGGDGGDALLGEAGRDTMTGGGGADAMAGGDDADDMRGGDLGDTMHGDAGDDLMHGDSGADVMHGGLDQDRMRGGIAGDRMFGEGGADELFGDAGDDDMVGGSGTAGAQDDEFDVGGTTGRVGDRMYGGAEDDVMIGDNGTISRPTVTLLDLSSTTVTAFGDDVMNGDAGRDRMYGTGANDLMHGNGDRDHMEGNGAADQLFGDAEDDVLIGGTSQAGVEDAAVDLGGTLGVVGDRMDGGGGADTMAGDNASSSAAGVTLYDVATTTWTPAASSSGGDRMTGGPGRDRLWGQGGSDTLTGDGDSDLVVGGDGADDGRGGDAADLLLGGSSSHATMVAGPSTVGFGVALDVGDTLRGDDGDDLLLGDDAQVDADGAASFEPDADAGTYGVDTIDGDAGDDRIWGQLAGDLLHGDGDHDYVVGDLATITPAATPLARWPGGAPRYDVLLVEPDNGGADVIDGDAGDDHLFGGALGDAMQGGVGDDYLEGNGGADTMSGLSSTSGDGTLPLAVPADRDQDDLIGGSSSWTRPGADAVRADVGEVGMSGNAEQDVMAGDNADVVRHVDGTAWAVDPITGGRARTVTLLDREKTGAALAAVSGGDTMFGNAGNDRMHGQGGADRIKGGAEDDYAEGNQDGDWVEGNTGEDDVLGGSSMPLPGDPSRGDPDAGDFLWGGADADVLTGDNAVVVRDPAAVGGTVYLSTAGRFHGYDAPRWLRLLDLPAPEDGTRSGPDLLSGGSGGDLALGQDGGDWMSGGPDEDYLEGNGGTDRMYGDRLHTDPTVRDVPDVPAEFASFASPPELLHGAPAPDGQDDLLGGSSLAGHRDTGDHQHGDGAADALLGDNGTLTRTLDGPRYAVYRERYPIGAPPADATYLRLPERFDVGGPTSAYGGDHQEGGTGDDTLYGQDGDDQQWGGDGHDDVYGELGADRMFGGRGEDAMVGDRGAIVSRLVDGSDGDPSLLSVRVKSIPMFDYTTFRHGMLDRRVSLVHDVHASGARFGGELVSPGLTSGGGDFMRGGPDRDSLHGASGDDLMNGDSGGDVLFGADGSDVLFGGRGSPDPAQRDARGEHDAFVDHLFGGRGGDASADQGVVTGGADVLDYRPRSEDPASWHELVGPYPTSWAFQDETLAQHHQGIDWVYGGWDRDVMQADVADVGPNPGDRLVDWTGAYNLYTHCPSDYGGFNDVRQISPEMVDFLEKLAYGSGAGASLEEVRTSGTSGYREAAVVHRADIKDNSSKAYPGTPGHFTAFACAP